MKRMRITVGTHTGGTPTPGFQGGLPGGRCVSVGTGQVEVNS